MSVRLTTADSAGKLWQQACLERLFIPHWTRDVRDVENRVAIVQGKGRRFGMSRLMFLLTVCYCGSMVLADEPSDKDKRVMARGEIRRKERLSELEAGARIMRTRLEQQLQSSRGYDSSGVPINAIAADRAIQGTKDRLEVILREMESVRSQRVYYPNMPLKSLEEGEVGILVDEYGVGVTARVATIVDERNMIVTVDSHSFWIKASTRGMKVGKQLALTMPLEVTGTTTHKSVGRGSKSIYVLVPFHFSVDEPTLLQASAKSMERR